jgi:hypothetical protein
MCQLEPSEFFISAQIYPEVITYDVGPTPVRVAIISIWDRDAGGDLIHGHHGSGPALDASSEIDLGTPSIVFDTPRHGVVEIHGTGSIGHAGGESQIVSESIIVAMPTVQLV